MDGRIILTDLDRPSETLEAGIIAMDDSVLILSVPNTNVQFRMFRRARSGTYEGTLGGRSFSWVAERPTSNKTSGGYGLDLAHSLPARPLRMSVGPRPSAARRAHRAPAAGRAARARPP